MSFEASCPQCLFVTRQLGTPTPCLLHVSLAQACDPEPREEVTLTATAAADYDEPYVFGRSRPTVDRPGPAVRSLGRRPGAVPGRSRRAARPPRGGPG